MNDWEGRRVSTRTISNEHTNARSHFGASPSSSLLTLLSCPLIGLAPACARSPARASRSEWGAWNLHNTFMEAPSCLLNFRFGQDRLSGRDSRMLADLEICDWLAGV